MAPNSANGVSDIFDPARWTEVPGFAFTDITYHRAVEHARTSSDVGCVLLTGNGPSARDGGWAFCSGGDQRIRGRTGYQYTTAGDDGRPGETAESVDPGRLGRLHIL